MVYICSDIQTYIQTDGGTHAFYKKPPAKTRGEQMSNLKKTIVSLPVSLLEQTDRFAEEQNKNRSELIREALVLYMTEQKKKQIRKELILGYSEMNELSIEMAEEGMEEALTDLKEYEIKLT